MYQTTPKDSYKIIKINKNIEARGYKSMTYNYDFKKGNIGGKIDHDCVKLVIGNSGLGDSFELSISGRKSLLKLRKVIDFTLEIEEEK